MKIKHALIFAAALLWFTVLGLPPSTAFAQGTAFTYQGQLQNNGSPASGTYDLTFTLFNNTNAYYPPVAGTVTNNCVLVTNGLFTVQVDFGPGVFTGETNWLEIGVETNGADSFTPLTPAQQLTPVPYAIYAEGSSNLLGQLPASQLTTISAGYGNFYVGPSGNPATSGPYNTAIGYSALLENTYGADNTAVGAEALSANTTGYYNTADGNNALSENTTGSYNTANGYGALSDNASGTANTANGGYALSDNTTGDYNTANGFYALQDNASGSYNTANGFGALYANTCGTFNTANGVYALQGNTSGSDNTANGYQALYLNTTGTYNTANGVEALYVNSIGSYNTVDGAMALFNNSSGSQNTVYGYQALYNNQSGNNNTAIGVNALQYLGANGFGGSNNIALGYMAAYYFSGNESYNIDIGNEGVAGDNNTIRIGDPNVQTNTFIAGVINGNGGGLTNLNISAAQFSGINNNAVMFNNAGNSFTGSFAGNGAGVTNVSAAALDGLNATNFWQTKGNSGTTPGLNFVGTTDNQPLELHVNGVRALRLEPVIAGLFLGTPSYVNVIGGAPDNFVLGGVGGATIGGGGNTGYSTITLGFVPATSNSVTAFFGTVGGGTANTAGGSYTTVSGGDGNTASNEFATVGGGYLNTAGGFGSFVGGGGYDGTFVGGNSAFGDASVISGGLSNTNSAEYATIGGGYQNFIQPGSSPVIGGGSQNLIESNSYEATIAGGWANVIGTNANQATIAGGSHNTASGYYAAVPGGANNLASGQFSFAAGDAAQATNNGAFVWADAEGTPFASTSNNQFNVRANGGVVFVTGGAGMTLDGQPVLVAGGGSGLTIQQNSDDSPNLIGGSSVNFVTSGVHGATIGGGGINADGASATNSVTDNFGTVGGGAGNTAGGGATVGGGQGNTANAGNATVSGGAENTASAVDATVSGGNNNIASEKYAVVGGGYNNTNDDYAGTVAGGYQNVVRFSSFGYSTVGGGFQNGAYGDYSTVGGGSGNVSGYYDFVGGGINNIAGINGGDVGNVIGGGGFDGGPVGFVGNTIDDSAAAIVGGLGNTISSGGKYAFIGGGQFNTNASPNSTISGGMNDQIQSGGLDSTIGGGGNNSIFNNNSASAIAGGSANTIGAYVANGFIGGGYQNNASGNFSTVPGGQLNVAGGTYSFAAGQQAQALHQGAFVWADSQNASFSSTANDQFLIRAQGGVGIGTTNPAASLHVFSTNQFQLEVEGVGHTLPAIRLGEAGFSGGPSVCDIIGDPFGGMDWYVNYPSGPQLMTLSLSPPDTAFLNLNGNFTATGNISAAGGIILGGEINSDDEVTAVGDITSGGYVYAKGFVMVSDRNAKANFQPVDNQAVLAKVALLPLTEWNYKSDDKGVQHIGPMAQDFHAAFGLNGVDDKHISTVDEGGVALAAIQGLNQKMEDELKQKDDEIQNLEKKLDALQAVVKQLASNK